MGAREKMYEPALCSICRPLSEPFINPSDSVGPFWKPKVLALCPFALTNKQSLRKMEFLKPQQKVWQPLCQGDNSPPVSQTQKRRASHLAARALFPGRYAIGLKTPTTPICLFHVNMTETKTPPVSIYHTHTQRFITMRA